MATLPNNRVGLNSANISDANINAATWDYVSGDKMSSDKAAKSPMERPIGKTRPSFRHDPLAPEIGMHAETEQSPLPKGTIGKAAMLRRSILQMSLAPNISKSAMSKIKSPSRLG